MEIITQRDMIRGVAERWKKQYAPFYAERFKNVYEGLCKLNLETCSAKDVDDVIGNDSWTTITCNECRRTADWVVCVGDKPDFDSRTAFLCRDCVARAAKMANGEVIQ